MLLPAPLRASSTGGEGGSPGGLTTASSTWNGATARTRAIIAVPSGAIATVAPCAAVWSKTVAGSSHSGAALAPAGQASTPIVKATTAARRIMRRS